jgi:hypothetical protein
MEEGSLPIRYLGVPLISKKLSAVDSEVLVEKIAGRITSWLSKNLTFAGRLQLMQSVLFSMQVYWSNLFILPKKRLLNQLRSCLIGFCGMVMWTAWLGLKLLGQRFVFLKMRVGWVLRGLRSGILWLSRSIFGLLSLGLPFFGLLG